MTAPPAVLAHRLRRALEQHARHLSFAATAQVCTLAAMVVPIVLRQSAGVLVLVYASSISIVLVHGSLLAFPSIFPVVRGPRTRRVATAVTRVSLVTVSLLLLPGTLLEGSLGMPSGTFAVTAALLLAQGSYLLEVARLVRGGAVPRIGVSRLTYGGVLLVLTVLVSVVPVGDLALTAGNAAAYAVAAVIAAGRRTPGPSAAGRRFGAADRRIARTYLRRAARPTLSMVVGGWTAFLPGLALPGLGSATAPWAITTRICGGFASVATTLVTPLLDARLSGAVRARDPIGYADGRRAAARAALGLAVVAVPSGIALAVYSTGTAAARGWLVPVAAAAALFWGATLLGVLLGRLPTFLGRDSQRLSWDGGRAVLMTAAFVTTAGATRLVVMGAVLAASTLLLGPLTRYPAGASAGRPGAAGPAAPVGNPALSGPVAG